MASHQPILARTDPLLRMVDDLLSRKSDNVAWLERAGPIAKRLNAEAAKDRAA